MIEPGESAPDFELPNREEGLEDRIEQATVRSRQLHHRGGFVGFCGLLNAALHCGSRMLCFMAA
jgi:hypothetical protein